MLSRLKTPLMLVLLLAAVPALADDDAGKLADEREIEEARRQQAFRDGMDVIVEDLNKGSYSRLLRAMDDDDVVERIFGLRLIDQRVKRDFRDRIREDDGFERFIESLYSAEAKDGLRARLLTVESRGTRGRAVVRFDMAHFQFNYLEYHLELDDKDRLSVLDWDDYMRGYRMSERMGLRLVQSQPSVSSARKLVDFSNVQEREIFQIVEVLKAARDMDFDRFFGIFENLDEKLQRQRAVLIVGLDAARDARKRRNQRTMLVAIDRYYPKEPLFALSLLDYYFPAGLYQKAYDALTRMARKLHIEDAVTNARLSSTTLVMGQLEDAIAYAVKSVEQEPDLELGWWAVLRAQVAANDFAAAVGALGRLTGQFGHTLDPEALAKDPSLKLFSESNEYRDWYAANGDSDAG